jgi:hypothetical protein
MFEGGFLFDKQYTTKSTKGVTKLYLDFKSDRLFFAKLEQQNYDDGSKIKNSKKEIPIESRYMSIKDSLYILQTSLYL